MFSVQVTHEARGAVFVLRGELDFESVVQLQEASAQELAGSRDTGPVVADCTHLTFCDSSGIGALLRLFQGLAAQQRVLRVAAVPGPVARLLSLTGLDQVFGVYADAEQALAVDNARGDIADAGPDGPARPKERQNI